MLNCSRLISYFPPLFLFHNLHGATYGTRRRAWWPGLDCQVPGCLKSKLKEEKAAWANTQIEVETLALAIQDLKNTTNRFATQIPTLEEKVKHLDNKVLDGPTELRAKELNLERITKATVDYKSQNARLVHKVESMLPLLCCPGLVFYLMLIF
jgi:septal ring factor EnvC (AmiA/AmiB activator)